MSGNDAAKGVRKIKSRDSKPISSPCKFVQADNKLNINEKEYR